ncbi:MAG TPA: hypothetical protein VFZ89_05310, partial [Solirubrobacteraceae bacterium]
MDVALGFLLGLAVAASAFAALRLLSGPRRVLSPEAQAAQEALHAVTATLPHLREGLTAATAAKAAPHLQRLLGADAVALLDADRLLAIAGDGADHHHAGDPAATLLGGARHADRVHVERVSCARPECPLRGAVVAPLLVGEAAVGSLV